MRLLLFLLGLTALAAARLPRDAKGALKNIRRVEPHTHLSKRQQTCYSGVNVFIPPHGNSEYAPDLLEYTLNEIGTLIPGSTYTAVPYNTTQSANNSLSIRHGQRIANSMMKSYLNACPNNAVALMGLSEGAIVSMNYICGYRYSPADQFPHIYRKNIVGVVAYGDESWVPNLRFDSGSCTGAQGPSLNPRPNWKECYKYSHIIQAYCDYGDPDCCNGTDPSAHTAYDQTYYQQAGTFVYNNFMAKQPKLNGQ